MFDSISWLLCLLDLICACVVERGTECLTVLPGFCVFWTESVFVWLTEGHGV